MPSFSDLFSPRGRNSIQTTNIQASDSKNSLDDKDKFVINLPKQYGAEMAQSIKCDMDKTENIQNVKIPWSHIPFIKPIQLPKEEFKGESISDQLKRSMGQNPSSWPTSMRTTKVKQKKKEWNIISPTSF